MSDITVQSDGTSITVAASGPQGIQGPAGSGSPDDQQQIIYVSKVGIDTASGLNFNAAKLTIGAAITAAAAMTPSVTNQVTVQVIDGGTYQEALTLPEWVHIFGPNAGIDGLLDVSNNCVVDVRRLQNTLTSTQCVKKADSGGLSKVSCALMIVAANQQGVRCFAGQIGLTIGTMVIDDAEGLVAQNGSRITFNIQYVLMTNGSDFIKTNLAGVTSNSFFGEALRIEDDGTSRFLVANAVGDMIDVQAGSVAVNMLYDLGTDTVLNLYANTTTGTRIDGTNTQINIMDLAGDSNLQGDLNVEGDLTGPSITSINDAIDFIEDGPIKIDTLANLSQYLNGSVYELPVGDYLFRKDINWGTATIDLITTNGKYNFSGANFTEHTYTGTAPWITTGTTGVSLIISDMFITTATATSIVLSDGNSLILRIVVFAGCKKAVDLDNMAFLTVPDAVPMVGCEEGMTLNNVGSINMAFPQWNSGQDLGGIAIDVSGAASERIIIAQLDSRPEATEAFFNFAANYGGDVSILGGIHTTGGGDFLAAGSRDQNDVDIQIGDVKNVTSSKSTVAIYIAPGDDVSTTIVLDTQVIIAGTFTEDVAQRYTTTAAGRITYVGKEDMVANFIAKFLSTPASGNNKNYDFYLRLNGTTLIDISYDTINVDAGTPQKAGLIGAVSLVTNDFLELIVIGRAGTPTNLTCEALALIIT